MARGSYRERPNATDARQLARLIALLKSLFFFETVLSFDKRIIGYPLLLLLKSIGKVPNPL